MVFSWNTLDALSQDHGDGFYLVDTARFSENYDEFLGAFRHSYPNTNIAYSYKTNYIPRLCGIVNARGGYAEVVSRMEYDLALRIGVSPERIIFNGPYKRAEDITWALTKGSIVNLDAPYEIDTVEEVASEWSGSPLQVGVRCNFDIGVDQVSRFGFDIDGETFEPALQRLERLTNVQLIGLHCHFLVPQKRAEPYAVMAERMIGLAQGRLSQHELRFIDLGGGYFSRMTPALQQQFGHPVPTFADYAAMMAPQFATAFPQGGPELLLEPGIALVADTMHFAARVIETKRVRGHRTALVGGSIYDIKPTLNTKNLPANLVMMPSERGVALPGPVDLVGYTCMEHDCLYRDFPLSPAPGDFVVFSNVGAYTVVLKPPFIMPAAAIIEHDSIGVARAVLKRRDEMRDVFQNFLFEVDQEV